MRTTTADASNIHASHATENTNLTHSREVAEARNTIGFSLTEAWPHLPHITAGTRAKHNLQYALAEFNAATRTIARALARDLRIGIELPKLLAAPKFSNTEMVDLGLTRRANYQKRLTKAQTEANQIEAAREALFKKLTDIAQTMGLESELPTANDWNLKFTRILNALNRQKSVPEAKKKNYRGFNDFYLTTYAELQKLTRDMQAVTEDLALNKTHQTYLQHTIEAIPAPADANESSENNTANPLTRGFENALITPVTTTAMLEGASYGFGQALQAMAAAISSTEFQAIALRTTTLPVLMPVATLMLSLSGFGTEAIKQTAINGIFSHPLKVPHGEMKHPQDGWQRTRGLLGNMGVFGSLTALVNNVFLIGAGLGLTPLMSTLAGIGVGVGFGGLIATIGLRNFWRAIVGIAAGLGLTAVAMWELSHQQFPIENSGFERLEQYGAFEYIGRIPMMLLGGALALIARFLKGAAGGSREQFMATWHNLQQMPHEAGAIDPNNPSHWGEALFNGTQFLGQKIGQAVGWLAAGLVHFIPVSILLGLGGLADGAKFGAVAMWSRLPLCSLPTNALAFYQPVTEWRVAAKRFVGLLTFAASGIISAALSYAARLATAVPVQLAQGVMDALQLIFSGVIGSFDAPFLYGDSALSSKTTWLSLSGFFNNIFAIPLRMLEGVFRYGFGAIAFGLAGLTKTIALFLKHTATGSIGGFKDAWRYLQNTTPPAAGELAYQEITDPLHGIAKVLDILWKAINAAGDKLGLGLGLTTGALSSLIKGIVIEIGRGFENAIMGAGGAALFSALSIKSANHDIRAGLSPDIHWAHPKRLISRTLYLVLGIPLALAIGTIVVGVRLGGTAVLEAVNGLIKGIKSIFTSDAANFRQLFNLYPNLGESDLNGVLSAMNQMIGLPTFELTRLGTTTVLAILRSVAEIIYGLGLGTAEAAYQLYQLIFKRTGFEHLRSLTTPIDPTTSAFTDVFHRVREAGKIIGKFFNPVIIVPVIGLTVAALTTAIITNGWSMLKDFGKGFAIGSRSAFASVNTLLLNGALNTTATEATATSGAANSLGKWLAIGGVGASVGLGAMVLRLLGEMVLGTYHGARYVLNALLGGAKEAPTQGRNAATNWQETARSGINKLFSIFHGIFALISGLITTAIGGSIGILYKTLLKGPYCIVKTAFDFLAGHSVISPFYDQLPEEVSLLGTLFHYLGNACQSLGAIPPALIMGALKFLVLDPLVGAYHGVGDMIASFAEPNPVLTAMIWPAHWARIIAQATSQIFQGIGYAIGHVLSTPITFITGFCFGMYNAFRICFGAESQLGGAIKRVFDNFKPPAHMSIGQWATYIMNCLLKVLPTLTGAVGLAVGGLSTLLLPAPLTRFITELGRSVKYLCTLLPGAWHRDWQEFKDAFLAISTNTGLAWRIFQYGLVGTEASVVVTLTLLLSLATSAAAIAGKASLAALKTMRDVICSEDGLCLMAAALTLPLLTQVIKALKMPFKIGTALARYGANIHDHGFGLPDLQRLMREIAASIPGLKYFVTPLRFAPNGAALTQISRKLAAETQNLAAQDPKLLVPQLVDKIATRLAYWADMARQGYRIHMGDIEGGRLLSHSEQYTAGYSLFRHLYLRSTSETNCKALHEAILNGRFDITAANGDRLRNYAGKTSETRWFACYKNRLWGDPKIKESLVFEDPELPGIKFNFDPETQVLHIRLDHPIAYYFRPSMISEAAAAELTGNASPNTVVAAL